MRVQLGAVCRSVNFRFFAMGSILRTQSSLRGFFSVTTSTKLPTLSLRNCTPPLLNSQAFLFPPHHRLLTRSLQHMASPSNPLPTEKNIYAIEEDPDDLLELERLSSQYPGNNPGGKGGVDSRLPGVGKARNVIRPNIGASQQQATFVDNRPAGASSLSSAAVAADPPASMSRSRPKDDSEAGENNPGETTGVRLKLHSIAPNFHALSTTGPIELYSYARAGKEDKEEPDWIVFFSHPMDFTPVCSTEMASIAKLQGEFEALGAKLLGLSVGTVEEHRRWMKDLKEIIAGGGDKARKVHGKSPRPRNLGDVYAKDPEFIDSEAGIGIVSEKIWAVAGGRPGEVFASGSRVVEVTAEGGEDDSSALAPSSAVVGGGPVGAMDEEKELGLEDVVSSGSIGITDTAVKIGGAVVVPPAVAKRFGDVAGAAGEEALNAEESLLRFPVVADEDGYVARLYGMLDESIEGEGKHKKLQTVRSLFIIDPKMRIRLMASYPHSTGRSTEEMLRSLKALIENDRSGMFTGASWKPGEEVIIPPSMSNEEAEKRFGKEAIRQVKPYLRYAHPGTDTTRHPPPF